MTTSSQLASLFSPAPPYQSHSPTSIAAAQEILPDAGTLRFAVYECIRGAGQRGCTDEEVQTILAMNPSTQRPRRVELVNKGLVWDSKAQRRTRSGRNAVVWVAV